MTEAVPARTALANGQWYVSCIAWRTWSVVVARKQFGRACLVVYVGADRLDGRSIGARGGIPLNLLLVDDVVLHRCLSARALDRLVGHCDEFA